MIVAADDGKVLDHGSVTIAAPSSPAGLPGGGSPAIAAGASSAGGSVPATDGAADAAVPAVPAHDRGAGDGANPKDFQRGDNPGKHKGN